jgi:hypothetical protein
LGTKQGCLKTLIKGKPFADVTPRITELFAVKEKIILSKGAWIKRVFDETHLHKCFIK